VIGRRATALRRLPALAVLVSAPGLAVLAALAASGRLAASDAAVSGMAVLLLGSLVAGRYALAVEGAHEAVETLERGGEMPSPSLLRKIGRGLGPAASDLWVAVVRAARAWRERLGAAEERAAAAEAVVAAVPDPLLLIDPRRRIVGANAGASALADIAAGPRDLAAALRNPAVLAAADAVLRGEAARDVEFTLAGSIERQLRARFARIPRPSPTGAAVVLALHDVTEMKRAEQLRADFIANASHELRTPLASLTGFIETLRGPARDDEAARERFLAIMRAQALRMTRLVEDLLSLSRIELNEHVAPTGVVALASLLRHVADTLELRAGERGTRIRLVLPADLPAAQGDRDELAQLFQNLIDNAIKYGRDRGEIVVEAAAASRRPPEGGTVAQPFVSVAVRDNGEGIPRQHLPRLTQRFYRLDTARSRAMGGTGLGLAIVKHIANRHRGFLEIESAVGVGSTFTVFLRPCHKTERKSS
jgi:two-component system phosphate regulon sensor histidine kinase PhoR